MRKKSYARLQSLFKFLRNNYFISIFFASIAFVGIVSIYKLFFVKPTYIYAKVKMSQGLWWARTAKPSLWFIKAIKKGLIEKNLTGQLTAKVLSVRYYPWRGSDEYDVYLIMKLKVNKVGKTGKYNFKRNTIGVGAPIDFEFPTVQFSGTIIEISEKPIKDKLIEKTVIITKKNSEPWEYNAIKVGDSYFDGEEKVVEVIDKTATDTQKLTDDAFGNYPAFPQEKKYIFVKLRIKAQKKHEQLVFAEERILLPGKRTNIFTENFSFSDYKLAEIIE